MSEQSAPGCVAIVQFVNVLLVGVLISLWLLSGLFANAVLRVAACGRRQSLRYQADKQEDRAHVPPALALRWNACGGRATAPSGWPACNAG